MDIQKKSLEIINLCGLTNQKTAEIIGCSHQSVSFKRNKSNGNKFTETNYKDLLKYAEKVCNKLNNIKNK